MTTTVKAIAVGAAVLVLIGAQAYSYKTLRNDFESRINEAEQGMANEVQAVSQADGSRISDLASDLDTVSKRIGVTVKELEQARRLTEALKREHAASTAALKDEMALHSKAAVEAMRLESGEKLEEVKRQTTGQIGAVSGEVQAVSGEVQVVKGDLSATRQDLNATRQDLAANRREMGDLRDSLGRELARNSSELALLRRRGERDYFEFDLAKGAERRIADIQLQLKKADTKGQKYDVALRVDDSKMEKKGQLANEPVQLLVGRDRLRYEMVVFSVEKDRIRGYVSTPKDGVLSAEGPSFRK